MDQILVLLLKIFLPYIDKNKKDKFSSWVNELKNGSFDDKRLLCCLGIEVKNHLVNIQSYVKIFNAMDYDSSINQKEIFDQTVTNNKDLQFFSDEGFNPEDEKPIYTRIVNIDTFITTILNKSYPNDDKKYYDDEVLISEIERNDLGSLALLNEGHPNRNNVWVTPLVKINEIIDYCTDKLLNRADIIINCIGMPFDVNKLKFIYMEYPEIFREEFYQSCAVNAIWGREDGLFLSYKKDDGFGRTRPCDGDNAINRLKEQVHKSLNVKYEYNIKYLGEATSINHDTTNIVGEAIERYNEK